MEIIADKFTVIVFFDPSLTSTDPFSYQVEGGSIQDTFQVTIDEEVGLVILNLETVGEGPLAEFAISPIQWLEGDDPIPTPPEFSVQRSMAQQVVILNHNTIFPQTTFNFEISVVHEGNTFTSSEPTIINTPIT